MPKLSDIFCLETVKLREMLTEGRHAEVKDRVVEVLATGRALPPMQKLAAVLFGAGRGRPATGKFKLYDIGRDAEELAARGIARKDILSTLAERYSRSEKHVDSCIVEYNKAIDAMREDEAEREAEK